MSESSNADHSRQVRARLAALAFNNDLRGTATSQDFLLHAPSDLVRLLGRAEAAEAALSVEQADSNRKLMTAWAEGYHAAEDGKQMDNPYYRVLRQSSTTQ